MIEQTDETHVYAIAPAEGRFEMAGRTNHAGHAEIIRFRAVCVRAIQVMILGYKVDTLKEGRDGECSHSKPGRIAGGHIDLLT